MILSKKSEPHQDTSNVLISLNSRWLPKRACFDVVSSVVNSKTRNALHVRLPSLHMRLLPNRARGHDEKTKSWHFPILYQCMYI